MNDAEVVEERNRRLRPYGADDIVCKVWTEAVKTALPVVVNGRTMLYENLDIAMDVADTITEGFIARFRQTTDK